MYFTIAPNIHQSTLILTQCAILLSIIQYFPNFLSFFFFYSLSFYFQFNVNLFAICSNDTYRLIPNAFHSIGDTLILSEIRRMKIASDRRLSQSNLNEKSQRRDRGPVFLVVVEIIR